MYVATRTLDLVVMVNRSLMKRKQMACHSTFEEVNTFQVEINFSKDGGDPACNRSWSNGVNNICPNVIPVAISGESKSMDGERVSS